MNRPDVTLIRANRASDPRGPHVVGRNFNPILFSTITKRKEIPVVS
jgi:hypothetical protein